MFDQRMLSRSFLTSSVVCTALGLGLVTPACDDDSSSAPGGNPPDASQPNIDGGSSSGSSGGSDSGGSPDGASGGCTVEGDNYAIYGAQLYKVSGDLSLSVLVGKISNQNGIPFASAGTSTTGAQIGTSLIVSDPNCPFCSITLPPVLNGGVVSAQPVATGFSKVRYFYSPEVPNSVVVWSGNGTSFTLYDLAQKKEIATAGILIGGSGLSCTELYAIKGTIQPTAYSVRILAECGDGSGPTYATIVDTGGTKVGADWQQSIFQSVATTKGMNPNPQIKAGDLTRNIFLGAANKVFKESGGAFVPDPTVYRQCNAATGASAPNARPLISSPVGG